MNNLQPYILLINNLCKQHFVEKLYVFGSVLTDDFNDDSDIDFIVRFKNIELLKYADNYFDLKFSLEDTLNHPVDLLEEQALKNPYFQQSINKSKLLIYG